MASCLTGTSWKLEQLAPWSGSSPPADRKALLMPIRRRVSSASVLEKDALLGW